MSLKHLNRFLETHQDVASHLCKRSSEDQAYDVRNSNLHILCLTYTQSARELTAATLGQELAAALKQVHGWIEHPEADEDLNLKDPAHLDAFGQRLKIALRGLWKDIPSDVFDVGFV